MNESKRLIKNTALIAIGSMSTKVIAFFLLPLYTAILSKEEYGTVDYIISISTFCIPFVSFLMDEAIFRFLINCKTDEDIKKTISSSFTLVLIGNLLFVLIGTPIMIAIKYKYTVYMIFYVMTATLSQMTSSLLRGLGKTSKFVLQSFLGSITTIILNVILIAVIRIGLVGMLISSIAANTIIPITFIISMKIWKYFSLKYADKKQIKQMVKYSMPLIPNKISWSIINLSDRIIIMNLINSAASGLYAAAYKFPNLVDTVYGFFYQSWKESSARILNEGGQEAFYNNIYKYLKRAMFSFVICLTAFMPIIYNILVNKSYNEGLLYVPILILATYFANISGFYGGIFTAYMDTKIMGITTIFAAVINLSVNLVLIKLIGLFAAAFSTLVANLVIYIYRKIKVKKYIILDENFGESVLVIIVIGIIWELFYLNNQYLYITGYVISLIYAFTFNRQMIFQILNAFKGKLKKN